MAKLGWLVIEHTSRDGCDISPSIHHYWRKKDAEDEAKRLRRDRFDECYSASVRKETAADAEKYRNYVDVG